MPEAREWLGDSRVSWIASVSGCIAKRPEGWVDRWDFNGAGLYETVDAANAAAGGLDQEQYRLFAYTMVPIRFDPCGGEATVSAESVFGQPFESVEAVFSAHSGGFRRLGYDPVQRGAELEPGRTEGNVAHGGFGCSPLSCNGRSHDFDVTDCCLLSTWAEARRAASDFAKPNGGEPGCYYVFGVYVHDDRSA